MMSVRYLFNSLAIFMYFMLILTMYDIKLQVDLIFILPTILQYNAFTMIYPTTPKIHYNFHLSHELLLLLFNANLNLQQDATNLSSSCPIIILINAPLAPISIKISPFIIIQQVFHSFINIFTNPKSIKQVKLIQDNFILKI